MCRILFACTELHSHGGIQRFNRNLVQSWTELGIDVDIVSVNDRQDLANVYDEHHAVQCFYANRSKAIWLTRFVSLLVTRRYDAYVCGHVNLLPVFALALLVTRLSCDRTFLILHGVEVWGRLHGWKRWAASCVTKVLAVSRYTLGSFLAQVPGFSERRAAVFPNTINRKLTERVPDTSKRTLGSRELSLLSVSRLDRSEREKGILDVIAALAKVKDDIEFQYVVVGAGDDMEYLKHTAKMSGIEERIHFLGAVSDDALWSAYEEANVFVLPSRKEGFGIVFLEAMYFGLPVIGAAEKGALDVIEDGFTGYLVQYGDVADLASRISELSAHPGLREQMGVRARSTVVSGGKFSYEAFRDRVRQHFT